MTERVVVDAWLVRKKPEGLTFVKGEALYNLGKSCWDEIRVDLETHPYLEGEFVSFADIFIDLKTSKIDKS